MQMTCTHERDDLGYPISANMCERCRTISKTMNERFIEGVLSGIDVDRDVETPEDTETGA